MTRREATAGDLLDRVRAVERAHGYGVEDRPRVAAELERLAREAGDETTALRAGLLGAEPTCARGDVAAASAVVAAATSHALATGDDELLARAHHTHAILHLHAGGAAEATFHAVRSVEVLPEASPGWLRALHLILVSAVADGSTGSFDAATAQALALAAEAGDAQLELSALNNAAWRAHEDGDVEGALRVVDRMRRLSLRADVPLRRADLDTVAAVEAAAGRLDDAWRTTCRALDPASPDSGPLHDVHVRLRAFEVLIARGEPEAALAQLEVARVLCAAGHLTAALAEVEEAEATHRAATGDWEGAYRAHVRFHAEHERLRTSQDAARAVLALARYDAETARRERDRFRALALTDSLTGLPNRRAVEEHAREALAAAESVAVAIVDVDHFKRINDELSHEAGDAVLRELGAVLAEHASTAPGAFAARLGGEEFVVVWSGWPPAAVGLSAEALRAAVAGHDWSACAGGLPVTVSTGFAVTKEVPATWQELLPRADARLYEAKRGGRDRVVGPTGVGPAAVEVAPPGAGDAG